MEAALDYWERTSNPLAIYALAGLFAGFDGDPNAELELTYEGREDHPAYLRLRELLETPRE